ncbi:UNVERIFIED_CONTAM: hypothetical protein FKN15_035771 [Acipenser sinensis]
MSKRQRLTPKQIVSHVGVDKCASNPVLLYKRTRHSESVKFRQAIVFLCSTQNSE